MKKLAIIGASGHGKVIADIAEQVGWNELNFFDDTWPDYDENYKWKVLGNTKALFKNITNYDGVFVAIGDNQIRKEKILLLEELSAPIISLIHPGSKVSKYSSIGTGTVIMPGVVLNADSKISKGIILNTGCTIDHDCIIGDFTHIGPGVNLGGGVQVGENTLIGIGASVKKSINIGKNTIVGAGSVVVNDLSDSIIAKGVPARSKTLKW